MSKISSGQLAVAFITARLSAEMIIIPGELIRYGIDRFWSILAAKAVVLLLFLPVIFMTLKFKGDNFVTAAVRRNRIYGTVLGILFALVLSASAVHTLVNLQLYISDVIFDSMTFISGTLLISAAAFYGAIKGVASVTRTSIFAAAVFSVLILLIIFTMSDKIDVNYLFFSHIRDESYFVRSLTSEVANCTELLMFAVLCRNVRGNPYKSVLYYIAAILVLLEVLTLIYNITLGPYLTDVEYPLYFISSLSDIVIFQRLDGIDAIVWVLCGIIKLALLFASVLSIYNTLNISRHNKNGTVFIAVYAGILLLLGTFIGTDRALCEIMETVMHSALPLVFAGVLIPLLVLFTGKKRRQGTNEGGSEVE